jgi:predicted O-linked N-acetylglucosamine transferase (SPINDLY family)
MSAHPDPVFLRAAAAYQLGRLDDAAALCAEVLGREPRHFHALHLSGVIALQSNRAAHAVELLSRAVSAHPRSAAAHINLGSAQHRMGRAEDAVASYDRAIALEPRDANAHFNRGNALRDLERFAAAVGSYDAAIAARGDYAEAYNNRGLALADLGDRRAALASFDRAVAVRAEYADAHFNRGNILTELADWDGALASYRRAVAITPNHAQAHCNLGFVLKELARPDEALRSYDLAIASKADYAEAHCNRGVVLKEQGQLGAALDSFERAIAINPGFAQAHASRADILGRLKRYQSAIEGYGRALSIKPDLKFLPGVRCGLQMQICDWREFDTDLARLTSAIERGEAAAPPLAVIAFSGSAALQRKAAEIWVREEYPPDSSLGPTPERAAHRRIRVGYFSPDFRDHPVSILTAELFAAHDAGGFETTGFSFATAARDAMSMRMERAFDRFIDVRGQSDHDVARLARSMEIDIAVDLAGFTQGARPRIFAARAAPLQVSYLGYPGTLGAPYMDYLIADANVVPEAAEAHYREKIIYLPCCFMSYDPTRRVGESVPTREQCGLPREGFVFCCFNNPSKIIPSTFDAWMRILTQVQGSVLWLSPSDPAAADNLRREALARNVVPERLVFAARTPTAAEHLARHRVADLFLDTLPYNAHTTAIDALWAGLPVLTCAGEAFAARVAASLLTDLGLPELIVSTPVAYESLAIELASDRERLAEIGERLTQNRRTSVLFDPQRSVKHLEVTYTRIYERHRAQLPPEHLRIERGPEVVSMAAADGG